MKAIIGLLTLISLSFSLLASGGNNRTSEVLHIAGNAKIGKLDCSEVLVSVYADGELMEQYYTKRKGKFEFLLEANTYYDLIFEKEGFVTKKVKVNTYTKKLNYDLSEFQFDLSMQTENELFQKEVVAAQLVYSSKKKKFVYKH